MNLGIQKIWMSRCRMLVLEMEHGALLESRTFENELFQCFTIPELIPRIWSLIRNLYVYRVPRKHSVRPGCHEFFPSIDPEADCSSPLLL